MGQNLIFIFMISSIFMNLFRSSYNNENTIAIVNWNIVSPRPQIFNSGYGPDMSIIKWKQQILKS